MLEIVTKDNVSPAVLLTITIQKISIMLLMLSHGTHGVLVLFTQMRMMMAQFNTEDIIMMESAISVIHTAIPAQALTKINVRHVNVIIINGFNKQDIIVQKDVLKEYLLMHQEIG